MQRYLCGPYTDPYVARTLSLLRGPWPALAVHFENESSRRDRPYKDPILRHHGALCAEILKGPQLEVTPGDDPASRLADGGFSSAAASISLPGSVSDRSWYAGMLDADPYDSRHTAHRWTRMAFIPQIKLATVSSFSFDSAFRENDAASLRARTGNLLVLCAAGNTGADLRELQKMENLSALLYAPGYFRVGECDPLGAIVDSSARCGPAFVCTHPFHDRDFSLPLPEGIAARNRRGTSYSTPHAGALLMHHTMGFKDLAPYEGITAALLAAAQTRSPKEDGWTVLRNQAGLTFDSDGYGFGVLTGPPLAEQVARLRGAISGTLRPAARSRPALYESPRVQIMPLDLDQEEASCTIPFATGAGRVVKVDVMADFLIDDDSAFDLNRLPQSLAITSVCGTRIEMRLAFDAATAKSGHGPRLVRGGFTTPGFFGEPFMPGIWKVSDAYEPLFKSSLPFYPLAGAQLFIHCLRPQTPGVRLLEAFQREARGAAPDSGFLRAGGEGSFSLPRSSRFAAASGSPHCPAPCSPG